MGQLKKELQVNLARQADEFIESRAAEWVQWRRQLHQNPELSWNEVETTEFIRQKIAAMNLTFQTGPRGLGGTVELGQTPGLNGDSSTNSIGIRGDIDAIPVQEANSVDYCSQNPSIMHACGHDVHSVTVLAVCETIQHLLLGPLDQSQSSLQDLSVRAIFQPAEEVAEGAEAMIQAGALNGLDSIVAMHVDPLQPVGQIGLRDGVQTACCDEIRLRLTGPGGHGARPHETKDPIFAATQFIQSAYATVNRMTDARHSVVLSFCEILGGHSANVIPTELTMRGTLRSYHSESRTAVLRQLAQIATAVESATGVSIQMEEGVHVPSVNNCQHLNRLANDCATSFLGEEAVIAVEPSLGGEDFAFYQQHIPGSLFRVGSAAKNGDQATAHLHSPHFDVDEQVISVACRLFVRVVLARHLQAS